MRSGKWCILASPLVVTQMHCMQLSSPGLALSSHQVLNHWFKQWLSICATYSMSISDILYITFFWPCISFCKKPEKKILSGFLCLSWNAETKLLLLLLFILFIYFYHWSPLLHPKTDFPWSLVPCNHKTVFSLLNISNTSESVKFNVKNTIINIGVQREGNQEKCHHTMHLETFITSC